jgi:hypothetical protein
MQEEFILLSNATLKKIIVPKVLNWDSTGYLEKNIVNIARDDRSSKLLIEEKPYIIRIALHSRDPHTALEEEKQMIIELKDRGYMVPTYIEIINKLQETTTSSF